MRAECSQILDRTSLQVGMVNDGGETAVEAEFVNNYGDSLWVPAEPVPAYRADPQIRSVVVSYGYFDDVYGSYRGRYMLPPMKRVDPGKRLRWRIQDKDLLKKLLVPQAVTILRLRIALREYPVSNTRGDQPVDQYIDDSCILQSKATVLRP